MSDVKKFQVLGKFTPELVQSAQVGQTIVVKAVDETGKPTEWEAIDFPEGGSGGSGAQADWSVNDPTAPGYVANRTHYENPPEFDIQWDGDMTGKFAIDMSLLGYAEGIYYVKVSDYVPTIDQLVDGYYETSSEPNPIRLDNDMIDDSTYPGAFNIANDVVLVYSSDTFNTTLGLPSGTVMNGVYFLYAGNDMYTYRLVGRTVTVKLDEKYLPDTIARTSEVKSLINTAINTAITGAIGGSY